MGKAIYQMTPDEALDKSVEYELKVTLKKARKASQKADKELQNVYEILENMCIDLETATNAENANNLEEAVNCYVQYGEYSVNGLVEEIMKQYKK